MFQVL